MDHLKRKLDGVDQRLFDLEYSSKHSDKDSMDLKTTKNALDQHKVNFILCFLTMTMAMAVTMTMTMTKMIMMMIFCFFVIPFVYIICLFDFVRLSVCLCSFHLF